MSEAGSGSTTNPTLYRGGGVRQMNAATTQSGLAAALADGKFVVTAEVTPPVSADPNDLIAKAAPLRGLVEAVNVTDGPRAMVHMSALAAAGILAAEGFEPIVQMTCRDRNRIALASDLLGAAALGVRNLLVLSGDRPDSDEVPPPKPVFDMESAELIALAATMRDTGMLPGGRRIATPPALFIGAADSPVDPPAGWRPDGLLRKIEAGARFVQTQFCFDIGVIERYIGALAAHGVTGRASVLIGLGPLRSARAARWMRENLWGVIIPDSLIARLEGAADEAREGTAICAELIERLRGMDGVAGVHLMSPGPVAGIVGILKETAT